MLERNIPNSVKADADTALAKKQLIASYITLALVGVIALAIAVTALRVNQALDQAMAQYSAAAGQLGQVLDDAQTAVQDLTVVSAGLKQVDWPQLADDISQTAADARQSLRGAGEALGKLQTLDIETLNDAIADLNAVIEPMARFFGR